MHLFHFDISNQDKRFYFTNVKLDDFLTFISSQEDIRISNVFAHSPVKEYSSADFNDNLNISDLIKFRYENRSVFIDKLEVCHNDIQMSIFDENEYLVIGPDPYYTEYLTLIRRFLNIDAALWAEIQKNISKYLLIQQGIITNSFLTFDEYLKAD